MMQPEPQFELIDFLKLLSARKIRYLLVGRWAVAQHGAPVVTGDYDFWVHPTDREKFLTLLEESYDTGTPRGAARQKPILSLFAGIDRIDAFFYRRLMNAEGEELTFEGVYKRATVNHDPQEGYRVRIPSIPDLIALKKMNRSDPMKASRDAEDIRYLTALKKRISDKNSRKKKD